MYIQKQFRWLMNIYIYEYSKIMVNHIQWMVNKIRHLIIFINHIQK